MAVVTLPSSGYLTRIKQHASLEESCCSSPLEINVQLEWTGIHNANDRGEKDTNVS